MKKRYIIFLFTFSLPFICLACGYHISYIATDSMVPALMPGDLIFTRSVEPNQLSVGDIITFQYDDRTICHRVVDISDYSITTKGDANPQSDSPITANLHPELQIMCKKIPFIGYLFAYLQNGAFLTILFISLLIGFLIKKFCRKKE